MRYRRRLSVALIAVFFVVSSMALSAPVHAADSGKGVVVVRIKDLAFRPNLVTVRAGTTVRWVNEDPFSHDVTSGEVVSGRRARQVSRSRRPDGRFRSGAYGEGESFEYTFRKPGEYSYFCTIHPIMTGVVRVVK